MPAITPRLRDMLDTGPASRVPSLNFLVAGPLDEKYSQGTNAFAKTGATINIRLDPANAQFIEKTTWGFSIDLEELLAHELGHASTARLMGHCAETDTLMAVVWENTIRASHGDPLKTAHEPPTPSPWYDPLGLLK
jgi:hypothetical protein